MRSISRSQLALGALLIAAVTAAARADVASDFSSNPLADPTVLAQGPDAANVNSRFTYDGVAGTLTAHYDTTQPTIKLLFPINQMVTQDTSFHLATTFTILSSGYVSPPDFGGSMPAFGLVNSTTTGDQRASTGHYDASFNFVEDTPGTTYDILTFDYFPTQDTTFGGNSLSLTSIQSAQAGFAFNDSFRFGFDNASLDLDKTLSVTIDYDATTHQATMNFGSGSVVADLTGATFSMDSFALTLWNDPNLTAPSPGSPAAADVVFDSFGIQVDAPIGNSPGVPEPASAALLTIPAALLLWRRRRSA